jgi:hypothetical protein
MPEAQIAQAVQLLDLMLEHFAEDDRWTRGRYDDGNGGHCLVGALLHLSRKHRLPRAAAIALLQDAMPRPGLPLVHFNDSCCGSVVELRSIILKARRLADDHAEQERAAAAGDNRGHDTGPAVRPRTPRPPAPRRLASAATARDFGARVNAPAEPRRTLYFAGSPRQWAGTNLAFA